MDPDAVDAVERVPHGSSDDPSVLDFSANTNPLVPDGVTAVYESALADARRYPPEPPVEFIEAAAEYVDCHPDDVVPTPGGLAAIRLAVELAVTAGDSALVPAPSFGEYAREIRLQGGEPAFVPAGEILEVDPAEHALAIVCNPNNPTGVAYDDSDLREFVDRCREAGTLVLVDEAFLGFTDRPSLAGMDGVVVARSLTKLFGLPGLRMGFAVATNGTGERLTTARRSWNLGQPALSVGTYCLCQSEFITETRERVRTERERLRSSLPFEIYPSDAPFLLLDVGGRDVDEILACADSQDIALRDARTFRGLGSHIRVAVRLPEENDQLLEVLADV